VSEPYGTLGATVPESDDYVSGGADVPKAFREYSDSLGAGQGAGKLLVVQSTGAAAWKAMSGDATVDKDGVFQLGPKVVGTTELGDDSVTTAKIGADQVGSSEIAAGAVGESELGTDAVTAAKIKENAVGSSEIAAGAVGTSELADAGATSPKLKPTILAANSSAGITTTNDPTWAAAGSKIPGTKKTLTLATASVVLIDVAMEVWISCVSTDTVKFKGSVLVNGVAREDRLVKAGMNLPGGAFTITRRDTHSQTYAVELAAGEHTLELIGVSESTPAGFFPKVEAAHYTATVFSQ